METRASHVVVGAFVLLSAVALLAFIVWLGQVELDRDLRSYLIHFRGSVTGLQEGSPVRYRGVPIGKVTRIRIDPNNVEQVEVTVELPTDVPIKTDTVAALELQGITGVAYVQLTGGTQEAPALAPPTGMRMAIIPSKPSVIEEVFQAAPDLISRFVVLVEQAARLLDPDNQRAFAGILRNLEQVTGSVAARSDDIGRLIADGAQALAEGAEAARRLNELVVRLEPVVEETGATFATLRGAAVDVQGELHAMRQDMSRALTGVSGAAAEVERLVAENRGPLREFSSGGLVELETFLFEARALVASLTRVMQQIEQDPARFLFGDRQQGVEAR